MAVVHKCVCVKYIYFCMEVVIEQNSKGVVEDGVVISQVNQIKFYMLSSHLPLNIILKTKW